MIRWIALLGCACCLLFETHKAAAAPVDASNAQKAVSRWIAKGNRPMGAKLGNTVERTETVADANGEPIYHVVYLSASGTASEGFIIVSGDDDIEPIVAFCSGTQFNPSPDSPLGALVTADLPTRVARARQTQSSVLKASIPAATARHKWTGLLATSSTSALDMSSTTISDVRVAPLVSSKWDQYNIGGSPCFNYYTPNNYYSGCVATALSQLLRFYQYPTQSVGTKSYSITVDGTAQSKYLRGGDGSGGAYDWTNMPLVPATTASTTQRKAIGALLYDAGLSVNMQYTGDGSGAYTTQTKTALVSTFFYSNATSGYNSANNIGDGLMGMVNPNLDAGFPVLFGIWGSSPGGHAIVCDGYGYNSGTLYHHLNMGWSGSYDAWYALPTIDPAGEVFSIIHTCVYNVYPTGAGEIVSGRVTDTYSNPIVGATVSATLTSGSSYTATTGSTGIYAIAKIPSSSTCTISAAKTGYTFGSTSITVGKSTDSKSISGNLWGIDFVDGTVMRPPNDNIANAWVMTGESWSSADNNVGMTKEAGEPTTIAGNSGGHSAWWSWTAPASWGATTYKVKFSTKGSSFDTLLGCYKSSSWTVLGSNDDESTSLTTSATSFYAHSGSTYRIVVDGKDGATGSIVLTMTGPATITTSASPSAGGTVTSSSTYLNGATVTLTAAPSTGYVFTSWTEGTVVVSTSATYSFAASATRNLVANFQQKPWAAWESTNFSATELGDSSISGPLQTPNHDGVCNLLKYAFRLDRSAPDRSALPQVAAESGTLSITYTTNLSAPDVTYTVEVSSDMQTWNSGSSYTSDPVFLSGNELTKRYKVSDISGTARFMRVRVTLPSDSFQ